MTRRGTLLEIDKLWRTFGGVTAVQDVSFSVSSGEIVGLIGPNGSGKSTTVNLISGELAPSAGDIRLDGNSIGSLPPYKRARLGIARSFQLLRLFPSMSVADNILLAQHHKMNSSILNSFIGGDAANAEEEGGRIRAKELLAWFQLAGFADRPVSALSIGQQRMVELARGMMSRPAVFLLDEPAAGLSPPNVDRMIELIRRMREEFGMSIVLVEHVMRVVRQLCDRVVVLDSGRKIAEATPAEIVNDPVVVEAYLGPRIHRRARS